MLDPRVRRRSAPQLRTSTRLVLDRVALTDSPSNPEALVFFARSISKTSGAPVNDAPPVDESVTRQIEEAKAAMKAEFEATQRAKDERIAVLEAKDAKRDEEVARSECAVIATEFKGIGAAGVDTSDLVYRARKAGNGIEADLIKILRASAARAKVGTEHLARSQGHDGTTEANIPDDLVGLITPKNLLDAGGDITRAVVEAAKVARSTGNESAYKTLSTYKAV